ncbi:MAG: hypothetical protein B5M48_01565 [Candidatus Omnitrophica bacterium 4484_213]|nr:MAG: hypothetical protein B5M48_01565 [Candidatus Omnitrophica bacterium 4484_213]
MKRFFLLSIICLLLAVSACAKEESKKIEQFKKAGGTILADINGSIITLEEFERKIKVLPKNSAALLGYDVNNLEGKKKFLDDLINRELLVQEAYKKGLDKKENIVLKLENLEDLRKQILITELVEDLKGKITVSSEEIEDFYEKYKAGFTESPKVRARQIIVKSQKEAKQILVQLLQGADFAMLAKEKSIGPNAAKGGDLGFFSRGEMPEAFDNVVFNLQKGDISGIIKLKSGYHIVQLLDKKEEKDRSLEEVREKIKEGLLREKEAKQLEGLLKDLKEKAAIRVEEELLR